jgi:two-component system response regulator FlrC
MTAPTTSTTTREPAAQALHELSNLLSVTMARAESLLADDAGADAATRTEGLESIRRSVLRARDTLGRLQRLVVSPARPATEPARERVLLIDDDPLMLDTLRGLLVASGYEVETATGGEEGLERYRRERFDCVITDARMRGVSGLIVCRAIKDQDPGAHVVLLTGVEHDPEELRAAGVDRVLLKPTRRANILDAVRRTGP